HYKIPFFICCLQLKSCSSCLSCPSCYVLKIAPALPSYACFVILRRMSEQAAKIKLPPNSKESEMMVLGSMLTSINSLNIAADGLEGHDFYYSEHRLIFEVLKASYKSDKPADVLLISEELKRQGKLDTVGGVSYITTLAQYAGTSAYIEEYVELI